ncbi:hypothetical protein BDF14DRAFT_1833964 [Spinellus fusiger]|nr:hypothetical protein BDF14DRAFT_1833964 [Spinellus fusiger]
MAALASFNSIISRSYLPSGSSTKSCSSSIKFLSLSFFSLAFLFFISLSSIFSFIICSSVIFSLLSSIGILPVLNACSTLSRSSKDSLKRPLISLIVGIYLFINAIWFSVTHVQCLHDTLSYLPSIFLGPKRISPSRIIRSDR